MQRNTSKNQPREQVDNNIQDSATRDDTMKRRKKPYNKKDPTDSSDGQEKKKISQVSVLYI